MVRSTHGMVDTSVTVPDTTPIETNNALEGKTMKTYTLAIERKYGDAPSHFWPAFGGMLREEAEDALDSYPMVYGEISRCLVAEQKEPECTESFLQICGG